MYIERERERSYQERRRLRRAVLCPRPRLQMSRGARQWSRMKYVGEFLNAAASRPREPTSASLSEGARTKLCYYYVHYYYYYWYYIY